MKAKITLTGDEIITKEEWDTIQRKQKEADKAITEDIAKNGPEMGKKYFDFMIECEYLQGEPFNLDIFSEYLKEIWKDKIPELERKVDMYMFGTLDQMKNMQDRWQKEYTKQYKDEEE